MKDNDPQLDDASKVQGAFTIFDALHLLLTLLAVIFVALIARRFGLGWAVIASLVTGGLSFFIFGYTIAALVLLLHRQPWIRLPFRSEIDLYIRSHFHRPGN